jgi:hypothetical protein
MRIDEGVEQKVVSKRIVCFLVAESYDDHVLVGH